MVLETQHTVSTHLNTKGRQEKATGLWRKERGKCPVDGKLRRSNATTLQKGQPIGRGA